MPEQNIPSDAPPSYNDATNHTSKASSHLQVPGQQGASSSSERIPLSHRRSMEDAARPLPTGWVRTYDPESEHQFYVDTTATPPRSVWHHPYDDEQYLATLSTSERERIEAESMHRGSQPSRADIMAAHSDDEDGVVPPSYPARERIPAELPPRPAAADKPEKPSGARSFGRKMKDALTGSTHEEREAERKRRDEVERRQYQQHLRIRNAMAEAARTNQPVLIGKDRDGNDVHVYPPSRMPVDQWGPGLSGYGAPGYGNMYARPAYPYSRPVGGGFGGGYGLPLAMGGGLLGGLMLADIMF